MELQNWVCCCGGTGAGRDERRRCEPHTVAARGRAGHQRVGMPSLLTAHSEAPLHACPILCCEVTCPAISPGNLLPRSFYLTPMLLPLLREMPAGSLGVDLTCRAVQVVTVGEAAGPGQRWVAAGRAWRLDREGPSQAHGQRRARV